MRTARRAVVLALLGFAAMLPGSVSAAFAEPCVKLAAGERGGYDTQAGCEEVDMKNGVGWNGWVLEKEATAAAVYLVEGESVSSKVGLKERSSSVTSSLKGEALGIKVEIFCNTANVLSTSGIEGEGKSTANIEFASCTVKKPVGCKIKVPIALTAKGQLLTTTTVLFTPASGSIFVSLTLEGCLVAGTYNVEGEQACALPGAEVEATVQEVVCSSAGSALKFAGKPATYETTGIALELASGKKFA